MVESLQQSGLKPGKAPSDLPIPNSTSQSEKHSAAVQVHAESESGQDSCEEDKAPYVVKMFRAVLGWMTPYEQMVFLRRKRDLKRWELFRDALMRRWSNLNVICGLIMSAVSTIVFADFPLSKASFTLGIISLLSSLIAIGFGVGLIYVLGDVRGSSIVLVDDRYPRLHLFALSIPEVWAFVSFGSFFSGLSVIVWEADNKGWVVKAGVTAAAIALVGHLVAFGFLFREQDTAAFLIPDEQIFPSNEQKAERKESPSPSNSRQQSMNDLSTLKGHALKGKATSLNGIQTSLPYSENGRRPAMPSRDIMSSETLVESPNAQQSTFRVPPVRASTVPMASTAPPRGSSVTFRLVSQESIPGLAGHVALAPSESIENL
ncbi:hypothetical protein A7U60_g871 [Sanghuangporus baumii]|uniref:Uncharacterized protein n=1 Tax=Sanghuangporus baumii TaxID=108892 RepID=A0A9Q5I638_SANBA|nr:hypothetical protein A7U60_g871 [Sanghuangporus baumii]